VGVVGVTASTTLIVIAWRKAQYFSDLALIKLSVTPLSGAYLSPSDTSKKRTKYLEQTLLLRFWLCVQALVLQNFPNLLVMDNFQAGVRKRLHM
jgi:hypothetical protein